MNALPILRRLRLLPGLLLVSLATPSGFAEAPAAPDPEGLVVWLDAAAADTVALGRTGGVRAWQSRAPATAAARVAPDGSGPSLVPDAFGPGRPALRFSGEAGFTLPDLADTRGPLMVFAVFKRDDDQASDQRWQRILSLDEGNADHPRVHLDPPDGREPAAPVVLEMTVLNAPRSNLTIGHRNDTGGDRLHGDLAELLIYDRSFLVDVAYDEVRSYLSNKWGVAEPERDDWTRQRPLPDPPARDTFDLPGWDQQNETGWQPLPELTDDFDDNTLDRDKWFDHNPYWYGRPPATFLPRNLDEADGKLKLTMRHEPWLPKHAQYGGDSQYHSFSGASANSKAYVTYGAFEIEAKAMPSTASSAWWFFARLHDPQGRSVWTEIDVFELGAKSKKYRRSYNMNAHVFETLEDGPNKFNRGGHMNVDYDFSDAFRVYGVEWNPEKIKYYIDGILVREMPNTHWHFPQNMVFDTETMGQWLGMPTPDELPATFEVKWVKAWRHPATVVGLEKTRHGGPYHLEDGHPTEVTRFLETYEGRAVPEEHRPDAGAEADPDPGTNVAATGTAAGACCVVPVRFTPASTP